MLGEVEIERQRYQCQSCARTFYRQSRLFDSQGRGRVSERAWEVAIALALCLPYGQASHLLEQLLGIRISATRLQEEVVSRGLAESERQGEEAHAAAAFPVAPDPGPPSRATGRQYVEMDGCFVHKWRSRANFELKVGEVFSDPMLTESRKRKWVEYKEYVSYAGDSEGFGERLYTRGEAWDVSRAEELYLLGDGAPWIKSQWRMYFPHARFILDWWHVRDAVWRTVRSVVGEEKARGELGARITGLLFGGELDKAVEEIRALPARKEKHRELRDGLVEYLLRNREGVVNYRVLQEQEIHIASGVIENACMDVIGRRMKRRGMGWTVAGAEGLMCLRTIVLNERRKRYWTTRGLKKAA